MQTIEQMTLKDSMYLGQIPVFIYQIHYPSFVTTCNEAAAQAINEYYAQAAKKAEKHCRTVLYKQAAENAKYIPSNSPPFNSYTFDVTYEITFNTGCLTSLYMDTYLYMGGAHGETTRTSDTWNFNTGMQLRLNDFYPLSFVSLYRLQKNLDNQVEKRLKITPGSYFDDYSSLIQNTFNPNSFYLQPSGLVIYFQQYDIAPYSTGIPEFSVSSGI
ncbi:DUF3298 and DUF4163 domain-containing protein [Lacrimispora sp. NSJ-141]|uniref:DUF3298 and DUF4163 domain-containing protein n=1 Tax=Lientehia hominis TaxID=2897778 RepID=A0AAP2RJF3_9FIRM|nr:DUF3298 and DUF4163 domain-containing protein [Lientehia hominis]MCD2492529.1 DUF3298 and DUF4163 domain-containing protein [Lientehia hominis]